MIRLPAITEEGGPTGPPSLLVSRPIYPGITGRIVPEFRSELSHPPRRSCRAPLALAMAVDCDVDMELPGRIFHIATRADWDARAESYVPTGFDKEGFIHCSNAEQIERVARETFAGRRDLILVSIDATALGASLVYEDLYDLGEEFPHLYGRLPLEAVVATEDFAVP